MLAAIMRALRRIATPAGVGLAFLGCSLPLDDFHPPSGGNDPLVGNTDTAAVTDAAEEADATALVPPDAATDACVCVKPNGAGKCKEWSPPGCGG